MNKTVKTIGKIIGASWVASNLISIGVYARIFLERHPDWVPTSLFQKYLHFMADSDDVADWIEAHNASERQEEPSE